MEKKVSESDINTILKTFQALSGEIFLEKLLKTLMNIIIENSGAQAGFLLLKSDTELLIEAEINIKSGKLIVRHSIPLNEVKDIAQEVINYVARTQKNVVLDNAAQDRFFSSDSYIKEHDCKSILCIPLLRASRLIGILYLENNLAPGAFTQQRQDTLNMLATQAAISLENALVMENYLKLIMSQKSIETKLLREKSFSEGIIAALPGLFYIFDENGRFIQWNRNVEASSEYSSEEVSKMIIMDFFVEKDKMNIANTLIKVFTEGEAIVEGNFKSKSGKITPYYITGVRTVIDNKPYLVGLGIDITERRKAEEQLKKYQQHLEELVKERTQELKEARDLSESIINSLPGIFYLIDDKGKFLRWNNNLKELSEFSDEELSRMNHLDFFRGKNREDISKGFQETFLQGESNLEAVFTSKTGKNTPYYFTGLRVMLKDNPHLIGTGIDITERKRAEEKLEHTLEALSRSNEELRQFAYVASHDLQEPLRTITSYAQLFVKRYQDKLDKKSDEFLVYILEGTKRMRNLIKDLLAYSRIGTQGKLFKSTNCEEVLGTVLSNLKMSIEEKGVKITNDELPIINGDQFQLVQLFQNLISNAIKFHGDDSPCVHISSKKLKGEWQFSVKDNGIGIDPTYFERIFIIFQRLHTRDEYPGTGLGLAICKKIVESHRGKIWAESEVGKGSTFHFTIPIVQN